MNENQINTAIKELANQLGLAADKIVPVYTNWYFARALGLAITWVLFSCTCGYFAYVAFKNYRLLHPNRHFECDNNVGFIVLCILSALFFVFFVLCIGTIVSPEGIAIHRILCDLRGGV